VNEWVSESVSRLNQSIRISISFWIESNHFESIESNRFWINRVEWKNESIESIVHLAPTGNEYGAEGIEDGHGILCRVIDQKISISETKIMLTMMSVFQGPFCRGWCWRLNEWIKARGWETRWNQKWRTRSSWPLQPSFGQCSSIMMNYIPVYVDSYKIYRLPNDLLRARIKWIAFCLNSIVMKSQMTGRHSTALKRPEKRNEIGSNNHTTL